MPRTKSDHASPVSEKPKAKQSRLSQTACPSVDLETALIIPRAIKDNFAGQATAPLLVADACGIKPASSNWRTITGAAVAYGLTNGGYNAQEISLTPLGERIVSPLIEGDVDVALKEAVLKPTILAEFYHQYDRNKLPKTEIAFNILQKKGVPAERLQSAWEILRANASKTNILRIISGSEYIFLDMKDSPSPTTDTNNLSSTTGLHNNDSEEVEVPNEVLQKMNIEPLQKEIPLSPFKNEKRNDI